jgi:hypothetical protein
MSANRTSGDPKRQLNCPTGPEISGGFPTARYSRAGETPYGALKVIVLRQNGRDRP